MFSRFRLAGVSVMVGVAIVGAAFYGIVNTHFLGLVVHRTLGPYSDTLAEYGFASADPDIWQKMSAHHRVAILVERPGEDPVAFDDEGRRAEAPPETPLLFQHNRIRAVRVGPDGTRVTFYYTLWSFHDGQLPLLAGLVFMVVTVVGSAFWFLQRQLRPLRWLRNGVDAVARGDFKARVPIARDDEIGQVARAFNSMTSRVGEMIDDRERLLADVSHELRSPIARMKVALELIPASEKRETLGQDLREMENLIAVLLERQALRSRTERFEGRRVELGPIVREVVDGFRGQGPGVRLVAGRDLAVHGDPVLLELLVRNLVDNAVKFSRGDSAPVTVTLAPERDGAVLRVEDDGIGIPDGDVERLFEPFVKADRARGHRVGYGVGLNLCQRIVQLHGATIRLRRGSPRGTEVTVTFGAGT